MGSGLAKKLLYLMTMLVKGASATHLPSHQAHISQFAEEGALQCSFESEDDHIAVAEWRERTRLCSTVWTDMEESTTSSQAAFHIFFITREAVAVIRSIDEYAAVSVCQHSHGG